MQSTAVIRQEYLDSLPGERKVAMNALPYALIGELVSKITPQQWIATCEAAFNNK